MIPIDLYYCGAFWVASPDVEARAADPGLHFSALGPTAEAAMEKAFGHLRVLGYAGPVRWRLADDDWSEAMRVEGEWEWAEALG